MEFCLLQNVFFLSAKTDYDIERWKVKRGEGSHLSVDRANVFLPIADSLQQTPYDFHNERQFVLKCQTHAMRLTRGRKSGFKHSLHSKNKIKSGHHEVNQHEV